MIPLTSSRHRTGILHFRSMWFKPLLKQWPCGKYCTWISSHSDNCPTPCRVDKAQATAITPRSMRRHAKPVPSFRNPSYSNSFPPRVADCITVVSECSTIRPFSIYLWISTDRCGQPREFIEYKIILIGMMIIMMITEKRKEVPTTKNVRISSGPRIIPALHKEEGHIRFCPPPAFTMFFLVHSWRSAEEWMIPELRSAHNRWMRVMQFRKTFALGGKWLLEIKLTTLNEKSFFKTT
jgi:hypothetical protein